MSHAPQNRTLQKTNPLHDQIQLGSIGAPRRRLEQQSARCFFGLSLIHYLPGVMYDV